ncbi:MAG: hypothetical protein RLZZ628_238 [Bacteroidota bacterium]|jgi:PBP1b-binding outer membrane lipoprotein LpoB
MQFKLKIVSILSAIIMVFLVSCNKETVVQPTEAAPAQTTANQSGNNLPTVSYKTTDPNGGGGVDVNPIDPTTTTTATSRIKISVTFGRASKGCAGFGICSLSIELKQRLLPEESSTAQLINKKLSLTIGKNTLSKTTLNKSLSNGRFLIEEAFTIPADVAKQLGVSAYTIPAGSYAIQDSGSSLTVDFSAPLK